MYHLSSVFDVVEKAIVPFVVGSEEAVLPL